MTLPRNFFKRSFNTKNEKPIPDENITSDLPSKDKTESTEFVHTSRSTGWQDEDTFRGTSKPLKITLIHRVVCGDYQCDGRTIRVEDKENQITAQTAVSDWDPNVTVSFKARDDKELEFKDIAPHPTKDTCRQVQRFFARRGVNNPLTLALMCERTPADVRRLLQEQNCSVEEGETDHYKRIW